MSVFKLPVNWQYAVIPFLLPAKSPPSGGLGGYHFLHQHIGFVNLFYNHFGVWVQEFVVCFGFDDGAVDFDFSHGRQS